MKKVAFAAALAAALLSGGIATADAKTRSVNAPPPINYGVADNMSFFADDGGSWFYSQLVGANLTQNRWEMQWDASNPTAITQLAFLQRSAPKAQAAGIHVVLVLDSKHASDHDPAAFCAWAGSVASVAKQWGIDDFVVWNEPNTALFWAPQDANAPAAYEALLAACYDTIHAADAQARVIGLGLSPRSNGPSQTAPIPFIAGVAAAYKASGRAQPLMDQLSIHPYPNPNSPADSPDVGYPNPNNYGVPNLDRVKQAIYDGFNGTGQPTTLNGLTLRIDELGWQTDTTAYPQYYNQENVKVVSEQTQADYIKETVQKYFACDPTVTDVDWFLLVDEPTRNGRSQDGSTVTGGGWQSGLMTAGGKGVSTPKAALSQVAPLFAQGRGACTGTMINWQPSGAAASTGSSGQATAGNGSTPGLVSDQGGFGALFPHDQSQQKLATYVTGVSFFPGDSSTLGQLGRFLNIAPVQQDFNKLLTYVPALTAPTTAQAAVFYIPGSGTVTSASLQHAATQVFGLPTFRHTSASPAVRPVLVAAASVHVATGAKTQLTLELLHPKTKVAAGNYYLALVLESTAQPSKRVTVAIPVAKVSTAAKPTKKPKANAKPKSEKH